ncbi:MAG: SusC/RagA family TonB-linked outer membrane protein [Bacteroidales bacterium]|nr:SusC/RagA family TonB-linked outer membrane protein [Bacteroidales bacterium]
MKKIYNSRRTTLLRVCSGKIFKIIGVVNLLLLVMILNTFGDDLLLQQRQITGNVTGPDNTSLPGVTVMVKGTTLGTITGIDGKFTLSIPESAKTLVISFMGMETKEIAISSSNVYNVTLSESLVGLEEVIVIGYGTAKKADLTGSVSRIDGNAIKMQAPTQVVESLSGTVAGLYSVQSSSAEGGGSMEIRGPTSLTAGTEPMIVLDGVIYNGSVSDINPADIESMDILRDASSAAVYGSKAASGVILITTTKGRLGKPTINFSSKIGWATTTNDFRPYGPEDYLKMHRDYQTEVNQNLPYGYYFNPKELPEGITVDQWRNWSANPAADNTDEYLARLSMWPIEIQNYKAGKTTNFYDLCIKPALRQDYSLSAGGGTERLNYYWSIGYLNNKGIVTGDEFATVRTRVNLDLTITDWLKLGTNTQFANRDQSVVPANLDYMALQSPYGSMWNEDGTLRKLPNDYITNPLENYYGQNRMDKINTLFSSIYAEVKLPLGFQYKVSFQPSFDFEKDFNFWSSKTTTGGETYVGGYGRRDESSAFSWMIDNLLTWKKIFGVHSFDLTLLANAEQNKNWWSRLENSGFAPNQNLGYNALQFGSKPAVSNDDQQSSGDALMARLNYSLKDKYLLTASIRRDGYSAFGQQNPRATFPAFALAWKIDKESFYKISWMNRLKLRLSWGVNGNRDIGIYSAMAKLGSVMGYDGANVLSGVYNTTLANPGLRWERTTSANIGFDIGLFDDRIDLSIDAYDATTKDLLMNRQLPQITGFSSITSNLGELGNRGLEISINTVNIKSQNINWRSGVVFSMNRNKIRELWGNYGNYTLLGNTSYGELPDFTNKWFPGQARDVVWDYDVTGIWQLGEETAASVYKEQPGDWKAVDVNEDGKYLQLDDKKFIGYTDPRYRIGIKNEVTFLKNFSASLFIRADLGHLRKMAFLTQNKSTFGRQNYWGLPYWSRENPSNEYARNDFPDNVDKFGGGLIIYKPTGFVRVQDFTLSYNLPQSVLQRMKFQNLRVFWSVRNLFTFTKWPGFDPESDKLNSTRTATVLAPMPKIFTFGLDLSL